MFAKLLFFLEISKQTTIKSSLTKRKGMQIACIPSVLYGFS